MDISSSLSADDSFLTWEKMCEQTYPRETEIVDLTQTDDEFADNEASDNEDVSPVEILELSLEDLEVQSPLPGSCEFLKNMMDKNTAICNLNDTLETVEYILAQTSQIVDETEDLHNFSSITLVSSNETTEGIEDSVLTVDDEVFEAPSEIEVSSQLKSRRING